MVNQPLQTGRVRKAHVKDAERIQALVNYWAKQDEMLFRPLSEIYESLRDFWVWEQDGHVLGTTALHVDWKDLAEIRSMAVDPDEQGRGIGTALVRRCLAEARELGVERVFALTYRPGFFARFGFHECSKEELPRKIWSDCVRCHKFPNCDEIAVMLRLEDVPAESAPA
ncbi:MAG: N-acetyltransferase [Verrucomicrobia bacterium]|nr:N-acetyltransferase [Verrucomicrobiota bacterium]